MKWCFRGRIQRSRLFGDVPRRSRVLRSGIANRSWHCPLHRCSDQGLFDCPLLRTVLAHPMGLHFRPARRLQRIGKNAHVDLNQFDAQWAHFKIIWWILILIGQYSLGVAATDALTAVYGTQYTIGTSTNVLCKSLSNKSVTLSSS